MRRISLGLRCLLLLLPTLSASAEDFRLSDGTVYLQARVVEVRPDTLILAHESGIAMVELAKLPESIRSRYNYDPAKAAAYRECEAASRKAIADEDSRLLAAHEARKMELARLQWEMSDAASELGQSLGEVSFSYGASAMDRATAAAIQRIGAEIARVQEQQITLAREPKTFWTADFWQHPALQFLGAIMGGAGGGGSGPESTSAPRGWR